MPKKNKLTSKELDKKFDDNAEEIVQHLDLSKARRVNEKSKELKKAKKEKPKPVVDKPQIRPLKKHDLLSRIIHLELAVEELKEKISDLVKT
jgi:hypothetical protein